MSTLNINTPANIPSYVMAGNNNFPPPPPANSSFDLTGFLQSFGSSGIAPSGGFNFTSVASTAANIIAPGIGGVLVNAISSIFGASNPNDDWKSWDDLDRRYGNFPPGGQAKYHIKTMGTKSASSIQRTMPNLNSWIQSKGIEQTFRLWKNFPDNDPLTPQEIYNAFKIGGVEEAGKQFANAYSAYAFPNKPTPYPVAQSQQPQTTVSPNVGLGGFGDDLTNNNSNNNNDANGSRKKNKWIAPALITVAVIGLMVLAFNAFKNKD